MHARIRTKLRVSQRTVDKEINQPRKRGTLPDRKYVYLVGVEILNIAVVVGHAVQVSVCVIGLGGQVFSHLFQHIVQTAVMHSLSLQVSLRTRTRAWNTLLLSAPTAGDHVDLAFDKLFSHKGGMERTQGASEPLRLLELQRRIYPALALAPTQRINVFRYHRPTVPLK